MVEVETKDGTQDELREMLDERKVLAVTGMSRTTLNRLERAGLFPQAVYVAPNTKRYYRDRIIAWQKALDEHDFRNPNRGRGKGRRKRVSPCATQAERAD